MEKSNNDGKRHYYSRGSNRIIMMENDIIVKITGNVLINGEGRENDGILENADIVKAT